MPDKTSQLKNITRVLLFLPDPAMPGGVVNYYSVILDKLSDDIEIEEFRVGRRVGVLGAKIFYPIQFLSDCLRLLIRALTESYDVYHFNPSLNRSAFVRDAIFVFILSFFRKRKILIFFRGWEDDYFENLVTSSWKRRCFKWFLGRASRILVLASAIEDELIKLGVPPGKIEITSTTFDGGLLKTTLIDKRKDVFTFLFMSRLVERKGIFELLDAAQILKDEGYDLRLTIAGSGPCENAIEDRLKKGKLKNIVTTPGYLRDIEKAEALLSADVFVLPSYHGEGCPNCILEAMGAGLPVITTRVGGIPDIVRDKDNGILLDSVTPATIADAMRSFMDDENLKATVSKANRSVAWQRYESETVAKYLGSVYNLVAAQA